MPDQRDKGLSCLQGLIQKRRKKHKRKRDLAEIKKKWRLFGQFTVDTKDLKDIPHYWPRMKSLKLPKYQFAAREVRSGLMFLGFSNEKSAASACLFGRLLCEHLRDCGIDLKQVKFQTDNTSEFIGCFMQDRSRDGFERIVEGFGAKHKRIPVRAWSYNSDVETVHRTIEDEFYDLENFESIKDFHQRVEATRQTTISSEATATRMTSPRGRLSKNSSRRSTRLLQSCPR